MGGHENAIDREVGHRILLRRRQLGLSQTKVATALGVSFQQIQKYETGRNRIAASRLATLSKFLRVKPSYFFDFASESLVQSDQEPKGRMDARTWELNEAFVRIDDPLIRLKVIELVQALASDQAET